MLANPGWQMSRGFSYIDRITSVTSVFIHQGRDHGTRDFIFEFEKVVNFVISVENKIQFYLRIIPAW